MSFLVKLCKECKYGQDIRKIGKKEYRWCDKHNDKAMTARFRQCGERDYEQK